MIIKKNINHLFTLCFLAQTENVFSEIKTYQTPPGNNIELRRTYLFPMETDRNSSNDEKLSRQTLERYISEGKPILGFDLRGIDLNGLEKQDFTGCKIDNTQVKLLISLGVQNISSDLINTNLYLQDINLKEISFDNSQLTGRQALHLTQNGATIKGSYVFLADFKNINLENTNFRGVKFVRSNFDKANFKRVNLEGVNFLGCSFKDATFENTKFIETNFDSNNLAGADLTGADLTRTNLIGADLTGADLTGADLTGADLTRTKLLFSNLTGADLTRTNLTGADLTGADLTGADLTGADLTGADLTGADLSKVKPYTKNFLIKFRRSSILRLIL